MPVPAFDAHLVALCAQGTQNGSAGAMPGVTPRVWQLPPLFPVGVDIGTPAALIVACDRTALNAACVAEYVRGESSNSGRRGVIMAVKRAIDYEGAHERALHARHASGVRCRAWASQRRTGHGDKTYGIFGCIAADLYDTISAAQSADNTPSG